MNRPVRILLAAAALVSIAAVFFIPRPLQEPPPAPPAKAAEAAAENSAPVAAAATATAMVKAEIAEPFARFEAWQRDFLATPPIDRHARVAAGVALARERRAAMKELIVQDPRAALARAVPPVVRQQLPPEITAQLEERVSAQGFFGVLASVGGDAAPVRREVRLDGKKYDAHVYGRRATQRTTENAVLNAIAVDRTMAVDERPLRVLDAGEIPAAREVVETCPISKKSTKVVRHADGSMPAVTQETPAVEIAGTVHFLCSGGHIAAVEEGLVAQEGGTGGPIEPGGAIPTSYTTGAKEHLYIRVTFPDQLVDPQSERDSYEMMRQVSDFMAENSFGACYFITTVTPLLVLPHSEAWYLQEDDDFQVLADARTLAKAAGYDPAQYDFDTVRYTGGPGSFGGQAYVGGKGCWLKSSSVGVAAHEYGHNLGLWHANYWNTTPASVTGPGANSEYGNSFDTMGAASAGNNHFTAYHKHVLSWLPDNFRHHAVVSGTYRIFQYDQAILDPARRYSIKVTKDVDRDYWLEFRQKFTSNAWFMSGIHLNWSSWGSGDTATGSNGGGQLLDLTPGSPDGKNDCPLVIGRTFSDAGARIHITPVGKGGTTPESVDVVVNIGDFPTNQAPTLAIGASATSVATGVAVNLTATANDPDSDPLAYAWDFGDKTFGANAAAVSKSWSGTGRYVVRCTASDMKGKVTTRTLLVTVGSPTTFTISGQITDGGAPVEGVLVGNGASGSSFRGAYSDSDGNYTITNLSAGSVTVSAALSGYTLTAGFTNPVVVGPSATGKNFTSALSPTVTLTATDAAATEVAGNGGTFRLTRTGGTAAALTVKLFAPSGSANWNSDYTLTPAPVSNTGVYDLTIAAGSATLDVALATTQDSTSEGVESAILQLLPATGYLVGGSQQAQVDISDDENTLPVVNIVASDTAMSETGGTATVLITRTGSTAAALTVNYSFTAAAAGIATNGPDFTAATSVVIPIGAVSAPVVLTPVNDAAVEGTETTTLSLTSGAAYKRGVQQTQLFVLNDDDLNVVSVIASDSAAAEAGSDPGIFTITRTGDTTNALTVDYVLGGAAHHGTDYLPLSGVASIAAGEASTTVTITPIDDAIGEGTQTAVLQLRSQPAYLVATPNLATINIADNDLPYVWVVPSDGAATEGSDTAVFRFRRTGNNAAFTLNYTISGTAVAGTDYTALTGTVSFAAADTSKDVTVSPINDVDFENAETVTVTITPDAAYGISLEESATIHILDNEQPMVSVSNEDPFSASENGGTLRFWFSRNGSTTAALDVTYAMSGTATSGSDYAAPAGVVTIPASASGAYLTITGSDDATKEGTETVTVNIQSGAYGARLASATGFLTDNETGITPTVRFAASTSSAAESAGVANVTVELSASSAAEVRVNYAVNAGSATGQGVDFEVANGQFIFAPGETSKTIPVAITDDTFIEGNETAALLLSLAGGAALGTSTHTLTITDNDTAPQTAVFFATAASGAGEATAAPLSLVVSLSAAATGAVSVDYAATGGSATGGGTDYTLASGTLNFTTGQLVKHVPLAVADDAAIEPNETVIVTLSNAVSATLLAGNATHTFTITDNDTATVTIAATDSAAEEGGGAGQFTVTRAGVTTNALTVNFTVAGTATNGADYANIGTSVVIPAGQASAPVPIAPIEDAIYEGAETVLVTLATDANYSLGTPSSATVNLADNDIGVSITASDATAGEPADGGAFTITRAGGTTGALVVNISVSGAATDGADFTTLPATVTIPDGQASATLPLGIIDDFTPEPAEDATVSIEPGAGYALITPDNATVTISDDDQNNAPLITLTSPTTGSVGIPSGVGLVLEADVSDDGKPIPPGAFTTAWSKVSGPGTVTFGDASAATTTATFSANGSYVLRLTADDSELQAIRDLNVTVGSAPPVWTSQDIGTASPAGSASFNAGTYTISGGGGTITSSSTADGFFFHHQQISGDFDVSVLATALAGNTSTSARTGLMARSALTPGASHMLMAVTRNRTSAVYRTQTGANSGSNNTNQTTPVPRWVRIQRTGNVFKAYHSIDGTAWTQQGSNQTIAMGDPVYIGFAATNAAGTGTGQLAFTGTFENLTGITTANNLGPLVDAGPAGSAQQPAPIPLDGSASDDALPAVPGAITLEWSKASGPGTVNFSDATAAQTTATFSTAGSYVLRLIADDGQVKTFDDVAATSTVQSPYDAWRIANFAADSGNPAIAGELADPDDDGLLNIVEFGTGSAPLVAGGTGFTFAIDGPDATFTYTRADAATDTTVSPQWSTDLAAWQTAGLTDTLLGDNGTLQTRRASVPLGAHTQIFFRLRVTRP